MTKLAPSKAEALGYVDDTARLLGQTGTVRRLNNAGDAFTQLSVDWDQPGIGLMLAGKDEIRDPLIEDDTRDCYRASTRRARHDRRSC